MLNGMVLILILLIFRSLIGCPLASLLLCIYISQLIRFARASSHVNDFNNRIKFLTAKLLKQGHRYHKLRKSFPKFYHRHFELIERYHVSLKKLMQQDISNPEFYGDWYINLRKSSKIQTSLIFSNVL